MVSCEDAVLVTYHLYSVPISILPLTPAGVVSIAPLVEVDGTLGLTGSASMDMSSTHVVMLANVSPE